MLGSWRDGAAKSAIADFLERVSDEGGADYVAPAERIAVLDNDAEPIADTAARFGWTVVSMRDDWARIFAA